MSSRMSQVIDKDQNKDTWESWMGSLPIVKPGRLRNPIVVLVLTGGHRSILGGARLQ